MSTYGFPLPNPVRFEGLASQKQIDEALAPAIDDLENGRQITAAHATELTLTSGRLSIAYWWNKENGISDQGSIRLDSARFVVSKVLKITRQTKQHYALPFTYTADSWPHVVTLDPGEVETTKSQYVQTSLWAIGDFYVGEEAVGLVVPRMEFELASTYSNAGIGIAIPVRTDTTERDAISARVRFGVAVNQDS